jgi:hypothetical protein
MHLSDTGESGPYMVIGGYAAHPGVCELSVGCFEFDPREMLHSITLRNRRFHCHRGSASLYRIRGTAHIYSCRRCASAIPTSHPVSLTPRHTR